MKHPRRIPVLLREGRFGAPLRDRWLAGYLVHSNGEASSTVVSERVQQLEACLADTEWLDWALNDIEVQERQMRLLVFGLCQSGFRRERLLARAATLSRSRRLALPSSDVKRLEQEWLKRQKSHPRRLPSLEHDVGIYARGPRNVTHADEFFRLAFEAVLDDFAGVLAWHAERISGPYEREDLLQEARLALWRAGTSLDGSSSLATLGSLAVRRALLDYVRRERRHSAAVPTQDVQPSAVQDDPAVQASLRDVVDAVAAVPNGLLLVGHVAGYRDVELAARCGVAPNTVTVRRRRARDRLRKILDLPEALGRDS